MQAVVKKVVYSFRYRPGLGQVGREVFHIVLTIRSGIPLVREIFDNAPLLSDFAS